MNQEPILRTLCTPVGCGQGRSEAKGQPEERLSSTSAVRFQTQRHVIRVRRKCPPQSALCPGAATKAAGSVALRARERAVALFLLLRTMAQGRGRRYCKRLVAAAVVLFVSYDEVDPACEEWPPFRLNALCYGLCVPHAR